MYRTIETKLITFVFGDIKVQAEVIEKNDVTRIDVTIGDLGWFQMMSKNDDLEFEIFDLTISNRGATELKNLSTEAVGKDFIALEPQLALLKTQVVAKELIADLIMRMIYARVNSQDP